MNPENPSRISWLEEPTFASEEMEISEIDIQLGKLKGSVTIQKIARFMPSAVKDPDKLEMVFGRMIALGIEFTDERDNGSNASDDDNGENGLSDFLEKEPVPDDSSESDDKNDNLYSLYPILSSDAVFSLGRLKEKGRRARSELFELLKNDMSPQSETIGGIKKVIREGASAQDTLVLHNLRLIPYTIRTYFPFYKYMFSIDELESVGREGLINAAIRYDPDRGKAFSTYACKVIRGNVQKYIQKNSTDISVAPLTLSQRKKVFEAITQFKKEFDKTPTIDDLHRLTELSPGILFGLINLSKGVVSLDETISDRPDSPSWGDFIPDQRQEELLDFNESSNDSDQLPRAVSKKRLLLNRILNLNERKKLFDQFQNTIQKKISTVQLTKKERTALELRFSKFPLLTYDEIATRMQVSRQWADELLKNVLTKLSADSSISPEEVLLISDLVRGRSTSKFDKILWK